jgi:pSer/pThr/pTyr-binding forkhead associated (FHA) protein
MHCRACEAQPREIGLLCEDCRDAIAGPFWLIPEQIVASRMRPSRAVLIDSWGRPHRIDARTRIGRRIEGLDAGLLVLDATVSRSHAELLLDDAAGAAMAWSLSDLGSTNGTVVDDEPVSGVVALPARARVTFGQVGFYFVADAQTLPPVELDGLSVVTPTPPELVPAEWEDVGTAVGLRSLRIRLVEPTGGGAGFVEVGNKRVTLAGIQFELMAALVARMLADVHQPQLVRGFVRSTELIESLSWDTSQPTHDHIKQLVRRVRRVLARANIGDLIEARYRFGYRLRVIPTE